jgi:hypothetical protein
VTAPAAIRAIGCRAHAALARSGGVFVPLPDFARTPYARADGGIVWFGTGTVAMHPRAVVLQDDRDVRAAWSSGRVSTAPRPWQPAAWRLGAKAAGSLRAGCTRLLRELAWLGSPRGLAALLVGTTPSFPLDRAGPCAVLLAQALRDGDVEAFYAASLPLLGLGPGLTPSGDDFVGAALFARQAGATSENEAARWNVLASPLAAAAQTRSHAIGAALFGDLAHGESFAPLHELATVLRRDAPRDVRVDAARAVVGIGHSSGWDMLAGFIVGATGTLEMHRYHRTSAA